MTGAVWRRASVLLLVTAIACLAWPAVGFSKVAPAGVTYRPWRVSAWSKGSVASLRLATRARCLDQVGVDCWASRADGTVDTGAPSQAFLDLARSTKVSVLVTVSNWSARLGRLDPAIAEAILDSPERTSCQVDSLASLCSSYGYDGVDLDWESLPAAERPAFTSFVAQLAAALHAEGKILSVDVAAKTDDKGTWDGAASEDYAALGSVADEVKVMTYDYSGSWSAPGPISPTSWIDRVLTYAEATMPSSKIWMGVPFYGYDWNGPTRGSSTRTVSFDRAVALATSHRSRVRHLPCGEATFRYVSGGRKHVVVYQDRRALAAKLAVLTRRHPRIAGICIWVMGGEDARFWPLIRSSLSVTSAHQAGRLALS